jgi:protein-tyrosine phosphatase
LTGPEPRLRVLTVCTHNRTRSVMMAALLERLLATELGVGAVMIRSAGFGPVGLPAIPDAVDAMERRGLDVSGHRSSETTARLVDGADVILTAERDHVVKIAALSPSAFPRAMTMPEFLDRAAAGAVGEATDGRTARERLAMLTADRAAGAYLRSAVPEIDDPTGRPTRAFEAAVVALEQQCVEAARWLVALTDRQA